VLELLGLDCLEEVHGKKWLVPGEK